LAQEAEERCCARSRLIKNVWSDSENRREAALLFAPIMLQCMSPLMAQRVDCAKAARCRRSG
jgi:hypothetical protein